MNNGVFFLPFCINKNQLMILKTINFFTKIFIVIILISFSNNIKAEEEDEDLKDIIIKIEKITKDLKTLETAFYKTSELKPSSSSSDGINEDILTRHLLKLNEIEEQFREVTNKYEEINFKIDKLSNRITKMQSDNQMRFSDIESTGVAMREPSRKKEKKRLPGTDLPQDLGRVSETDLENKVKFLLTAHHKDDQVETFLIRLSRGSGVEGLSSMSQFSNLKYGIKLIRPFLGFKKKELKYAANKFFNKTIKDQSNRNKKFLRTNIRELTKILESKGLSLDQIIRSINNISSTKEAINFYVNRSIKKFVKFKKKETVLNLQMFKKEPEEVKFKIINKIVKNRALSYYPPRSHKVLNLISRFETKNSKKCTLGGCIFERRKNLLHVTREF